MTCMANYNALRRQLHVLQDLQDDPALRPALLKRLEDGGVAVPVILPGHKECEEVDDQERVQLLEGVPVVADQLLVEVPLDHDRLGVLASLFEEYGFGSEPSDRLEFPDAVDANGERRPVAMLLLRAEAGDGDITGAITAINASGDLRAIAHPNTLRVMNVVTKSKSGAEPACCAPKIEGIDDPEAGLVVVLDTGKFLADHRDGLLHGVTGDPDPRVADDGPLLVSAGHGTFIAGVIRQVRPRTRIVVKRVIGPEGFVADWTLAKAIAAAADEIGPNGGVINLSFGSEDLTGIEPLAVKNALAALPPNVAVVCAAGNENTGEKIYPAAFTEDFDHVVAVAALNHEGYKSAWSNRGDWVDFSAIGEGIVSTYLPGEEREGTGEPGDPYDPEPDVWLGRTPWAVWTGTSFAAPQVAALLAERIASGMTAAKAIAELRKDLGGDVTAMEGFGVPVPKPNGLSVVQKPELAAGPNPQP